MEIIERIAESQPQVTAFPVSLIDLEGDSAAVGNLAKRRLHEIPITNAEVPANKPETVINKPPKKDKKGKNKLKGKSKKTLGTARGIETMFRTSYRVNMDLSALADTKSNMIMGVNSIVISVILAAISPKIDANPWLLFPTTVLLVGCLISLVYAILAARPRVSSTAITLEDVRQNNANILFFGNFAHMTRDDYVQGMTELLQNTDNLYYNMIIDIYGLGAVLQKKFRLLRTSYTVLMFAVIFGVLSFIIVYILVATAGPLSPVP